MSRFSDLQRRSHPIVYLMLILPFGAVGGYLSVAEAYTLAQKGMSVAQIGLLIALYLAPQAWKFVWAPIVDTTLTRKSWYLIGATLSAVSVTVMAEYSTHTAQFLALCVVVVISSLAVTFLGMSVESLMAYDTPDSEKGRAAGWFQAGNLGGSGLGGGAALWLAQRVSMPWLPGAALGVCFAICCLVLLFVSEPHGGAHDRASRNGC
jgi:MFS family permease